MSLPAPTSPIWLDIISGKKQIQFDFLAVKIFLGSAQAKYKQNPTEGANIAKEMYALFSQNLALPSVQKDIQKLL